MERPAMTQLCAPWSLDVERGPDWLFIRLHPPDDAALPSAPLADTIWQQLQQHFTYRLVLEMDQVSMLPSWLVGQLVLLRKRIDQHGGLLRLCGCTAGNQEVLEATRLGACFPRYSDRQEAVLGWRPTQPR
jgi:anti-anti-sigma regulatory factor